MADSKNVPSRPMSGQPEAKAKASLKASTKASTKASSNASSECKELYSDSGLTSTTDDVNSDSGNCSSSGAVPVCIYTVGKCIA